jgi:hypothetical protein
MYILKVYLVNRSKMRMLWVMATSLLLLVVVGWVEGQGTCRCSNIVFKGVYIDINYCDVSICFYK